MENLYFVASGTWNFLGRVSIGGAGGGNWTKRLRIRFRVVSGCVTRPVDLC
jgi:hypothetical protein